MWTLQSKSATLKQPQKESKEEKKGELNKMCLILPPQTETWKRCWPSFLTTVNKRYAKLLICADNSSTWISLNWLTALMGCQAETLHDKLNSKWKESLLYVYSKVVIWQMLLTVLVTGSSDEGGKNTLHSLNSSSGSQDCQCAVWRSQWDLSFPSFSFFKEKKIKKLSFLSQSPLTNFTFYLQKVHHCLYNHNSTIGKTQVPFIMSKSFRFSVSRVSRWG